MKTSRIILVALVLTAVVSPLRAQEKIEQLFQRMVSDSKVQVKTNIQKDHNPKLYQQANASTCKIHNFYIPKPKGKARYAERQEYYVTDIANAIQAEYSNPNCYRISSYNVGDPNPLRPFNIIYSEDATQYIPIGTSRAKNYILACFLDKKNPGFRWCYALEWWGNGSNGIYGRYMVFYSKIPTEKVSTTQQPDKKRNNASMHFLANFNTLQTRWMNGEYQTDATLPVSIYTLVKDAVAANILTLDEKKLVEGGLLQMREAVAYKKVSQAGIFLGFIDLAHKILWQDK